MAGKEHVLIVNDFHPETVAGLRKDYTAHLLWQIPAADRADWIRGLNGTCRAAATASWYCDDIIYALDSLECIACFGVGVDAIDFVTTAARAIRVSNTPGVLDDAVADLAMALILAATRKLPAADRFARDGSWEQGPFPLGMGLAGKTLGILGLGSIGEAVARRALPFRLRIAYHNRQPRNLPYRWLATPEALAEASDILLCLLPATQATTGLVNRKVLDKLGPDGVFVNAGRGAAVNETELTEALASGAIAAAGLDVYASEPRIPPALKAMDNVVLLPHIGSATVETRRAMGQLVMDNLAAFFSARPLLTEVRGG